MFFKFALFLDVTEQSLSGEIFLFYNSALVILLSSAISDS